MRIWALSFFAVLLLFLSHVDADNALQQHESVAPQPIDAPIRRRNSGIVRNPKRIRAVMNGLKIAPNFRSRRIRESKDVRGAEISPYRFVVINKTQLDRERNFYLSGYRIDKNGDLGVYFAPLQLINWVQKKNSNVNPEEVLESLPPLKMDIVPPIPHAIQQQIAQEAGNTSESKQETSTSVQHRRKQRRRPAASAVKSAVNQEAKILDDILMSLGQSFAQAGQMKKQHKKHIKSQDYSHLKRFESEPNKENFVGDTKKFSTDAQNHVVVRANALNPDEFISVKEAHQPKLGPLQSKVEELDETVNDKYEFAKVRQNVNDASTALPMGIPPPPPPLDSEVWAERKQKALVRPMVTLVTSENNNDSVKIPLATADPVSSKPATSESRQKSPVIALVPIKDGTSQGLYDVEDISMPNFMESSTDIQMVAATTLQTTTEFTTPRILVNDDYAEEERLLAAGVTSRFGERPEDDFDDITTVAFTTQTTTSTPVTTTEKTTSKSTTAQTTTSKTTTSSTTMSTTASTTARTTRSTSVSTLAPQQGMVIVPMEMSALSHSLTLSQSRSPSLPTKFNLLDEIQEEIAILDGRKGEGDVRNVHVFSSTTRRTTPTPMSTTTQKYTSTATMPTTTMKIRQTASTSTTASTTSASRTTSTETTTKPTNAPMRDKSSSQPTDVTAPILVSSFVTTQPQVVHISPVSFAIAPESGSGLKDISGVELTVTTEEMPTTETAGKMEELEESAELVHPTLIPDNVVVQLLGGESNKGTVEKIGTGINSTETVLEGEETTAESANFTTTPAVTTEQQRNSSRSKESSESSSESEETRRRHHKHPRSRRNRNRSSRRDDSHSRSYSESRSTSSDEESTMVGDIEMVDSREARRGNNKIVSYPIQVQPRKKQMPEETGTTSEVNENETQQVNESSTVPVAKPVPTSSTSTTTTTTSTTTIVETTTRKHRHRHHGKRRRHHHRRRYSDSFDSDEDSYERPTTSRVKEEIKTIMTTTPISSTVIDEREHLMQPAMIDGESDSATVFVSTASKSEFAPNTEVDQASVVKVEESVELTTTASTQSAPTLVDADAGRERVDSSKEEPEELNNKKSPEEMKVDAEAEEKRMHDNEVARQIAEIIRKRRLREKVHQNSVEREVLVRGGSEPETDDLSEEKAFPRETPEEATTNSPNEEEKTYLVRRTVKEVIPLPVARQVPEARLPSLVERFESQLPITSDSAGGFILQDVLLSHRNLPNADPIFIQNIKTNPESEQFQFVNDQFATSLMGVPQINIPQLIDTNSRTPISIRPPVARVPSLNTHRQRRRKPASTERVPTS